MITEKTKNLLFYLHVVPLCFWAFDVLTTLYVIDYLGVAVELNPLGWPFGAWGALMFYIPALIFTYLLLFRIRTRYSLLAATILTITAIGLGVMNLLAGIHNVQVAQ